MNITLPYYQTQNRYLIYGIGNMGRHDDGLGIYFIDLIEEFLNSINDDKFSNIELKSHYQLNIEDAYEISLHDIILFIDAKKAQPTNPKSESFEISKIQSQNSLSFSTHSLSMESVLSLCEELYQVKPLVYLLSITGYQWSIHDQLTQEANNNLHLAYNYFMKWILKS